MNVAESSGYLRRTELRSLREYWRAVVLLNVTSDSKGVSF
jgi:hypothetical protein